MKFFSDLRSGVLTALFGGFSLLGERPVFLAAVLLLLIFLPREQKKRLFFAIILSAALGAIFKYALLRPRPYVSGEIVKLDPPFSLPSDPHTSFPSGHAQLTATLSGCLVTENKWSRLFFLLPLPVALSRLYFGVHYPTDVLFGLFFGFAAVLIVRAFPARARNT